MDIARAIPARERFLELASRHAVVPVAREFFADTLTPVAAYRAVRGTGPSFLLESVEHGERWALLVHRNRPGHAHRGHR